MDGKESLGGIAVDVDVENGRIDLRLRSRPKSEVVAFGKLMTALAMMKGQPWVPFQVEIIEDRTVHIPLPVLTRAVAKIVDAGGWRPDVEGILQACEQARLEIRDVLRFESCEQCSQQGWTEVEIDGVRRAVRCQCWTAHQERVKALGAGDVPLALPAPVQESSDAA